MDHQFKVRQVDAAGGDIGGDTDPRTPVAQRLQRVGPLRLRQLTRQRHDREPPVGKARGQTRHGGAGVAEHDGVFGLVKAQHVDDRVFSVTRVHIQRAVFDIAVLFGFAHSGNALRVALVGFRQFGNRRRHGGREQQRAALFGGFGEDELKVFAKTEVEHLIRFVQHHGADRVEVDIVAFDVVTQTARRGDDDMRATVQRAALGPGVHATDAGGDHRARFAIKPRQLAADLHRQFACGRDNQRQRCACLAEMGVVAQECWRDGEAKAHRFARPGLGGNQKVLIVQRGVCDGLLYGGKCFITLLGKGIGNSLDHEGCPVLNVCAGGGHVGCYQPRQRNPTVGRGSGMECTWGFLGELSPFLPVWRVWRPEWAGKCHFSSGPIRSHLGQANGAAERLRLAIAISERESEAIWCKAICP